MPSRIDTKFLERFFDSSLDLCGFSNTDGYFVHLNPSWSKALGWSKEELCAKPFLDFVHDEDKPKTLKQAEALYANRGDAVEFENRYRCKDSTYRWLSWNARLDPEIDLITFNARDITDRKRTEMALEGMQRMARVGTWNVSLDPPQPHWSEETYRIHEVELGTPIKLEDGINFYVPEDRPRIEAAVTKCMETGESFDGEFQILTAKGNQKWVRSIGHAEIQDGKAVRLYGSFQDIDQQKKAEFRLKAVLESTADLTFVIDKHLVYQECYNPGAEDLFLPLDKVIGANMRDIFPKEVCDRTESYISETIKSGRVQIMEYEAPVGESTGYFQARFAKFTDESAVVSIRNVTEQKMAEIELQAERANTINAAKMAELGEIAGGVAHEINNPLAVIQGSAYHQQKMLKKSDINPDELLALSEKIDRTSQRIAKIVRSLRTYARDGSKDPFERTPITQILDDVADLCSKRLENMRIRFSRPEEDSLKDLSTECRSVQVSQVLVNLINNAVDAVSDLEEKWVDLSVEGKPDSVQIRVTDSGHGIPKEIADKILIPFFTTKPVGKGTGLGLSISQRMVQDHGGTLEIDQSSKNTCFVLTLPIHHPS